MLASRKRCGVAISVAGYHALDFGAIALGNTITALREAGVASGGGGATLDEARVPAIIEVAVTKEAGIDTRFTLQGERLLIG